jgi:hypothetical protein
MADTTTPLFGLTLPGNLDPAGSGLWGPKVNSDFSSIDGFMGRPQIQFQSPTVGATTTLDLAQGRAFVFTVSQATTIAFANVPSASFMVRIRLLITNGSAFAVTWPASVSWLAGIVPTLKASGVDEIEMVTKDGGTTWYAAIRDLRPGTIFQASRLTTTSGVDASLGSYVLPAGTLAVNGHAIRVTIGGQAPAGGATVNIKFGATQILGAALTASQTFWASIIVTRAGATVQDANSMNIIVTTAIANLISPAETLANAITVDFRGNATTGGQTLTYHTVQVELLVRP